MRTSLQDYHKADPTPTSDGHAAGQTGHVLSAIIADMQLANEHLEVLT